MNIYAEVGGTKFLFPWQELNFFNFLHSALSHFNFYLLFLCIKCSRRNQRCVRNESVRYFCTTKSPTFIHPSILLMGRWVSMPWSNEYGGCLLCHFFNTGGIIQLLAILCTEQYCRLISSWHAWITSILRPLFTV